MFRPSDIVLIAVTLGVVLILTWWILSILRPTQFPSPMKYLPKLTVRDLLWLVVVVALSVVVWMQYKELASLRKEHKLARVQAELLLKLQDEQRLRDEQRRAAFD